MELVQGPQLGAALRAGQQSLHNRHLSQLAGRVQQRRARKLRAVLQQQGNDFGAALHNRHVERGADVNLGKHVDGVAASQQQADHFHAAKLQQRRRRARRGVETSAEAPAGTRWHGAPCAPPHRPCVPAFPTSDAM